VTVYVHEQNDDGSLRGILVHDERKRKLPITMMAEEGVLVQGDDGPLFMLERGNRQELDTSGPNVSILHFERYTLDLAATAGRPSARSPKPKEQFVHQLLNPPEALSEDRRRGRIAEAHKRLLWPLNALVFTLIALAALLSGRIDRRGPWRRTLFAVVVTTIVQALTMAAGSLASRSLAMLPLLYLVSLAPAVIALAVLLGLRPWRPLPTWRLARA
jgi:lipopolysaccharide export system permease protein